MSNATDRLVSRRQFLAASAGGTVALALGAHRAAGEAQPADGLHFFLIGDTHYLADKDQPGRLDGRSKSATSGLIDALNRLPGTTIPESAGGGVVGRPAGVIHAGDMIDSGDKGGQDHARMQQDEWDAYVADFGLTGKDGRLKYPVYELHGNHDGPGGRGIPLDGIIRRNKTRPGVTHVSPNGLHYSWDWGRVHLICLGIVVGQVKSVSRRRRYAPLESLDFLIDDLKTHVGDSGRPVIITHHVDVARYTGRCDPNAPFDNKEWDPCDVHAYYEAMKPYNVVAVFYGHTHARNVFKWDGASARADRGIDVFNVTQASHFHSGRHGLFYVHLSDDRLTVRECQTENNWAEVAWTPTVWTQPIRNAAT